MPSSRVEHRRRITFPWGRYVGFLTSAIVMFIGVALGNDPITILAKSFVSGIVMGAIVGFGVGLIQLVDADQGRKLD